MRLPIAAFLVGLGWGAQAAAQTAAPSVPRPTPPAPPASDLYVHTIAPRDTLIALGRVLLATPARWREVQRLNHVRNPRRLRPGATLAIPLALLKTIPASAQVLWLRGAPRVRLVDGTNAVALIGATLGEGARLTTQAGESIGLRLTTGAVVTIGEGADVAFNELRSIPAANAARTGIDLRRGRIQNAVPPGNAPRQRYEIRTPVVTTAVRGTTFRVGVDDAGGAAMAEVLGGQVGVARAAESMDVGAGFGTVARQNVPLTLPKPLLPAPTIETAAVQQRLPARVRWAAVTGAMGYRAELRAGAPTAAAADPLIDERMVAGPEANWADIPDGVYRVVVRAIDAEAMEGADADARFEVDARPEPPIAQAPVLDAVLFGDRAAFAWTRPSVATGFDLELSAEGNATPVVSRSGLVDAKIETPLAPGRYTWRVRSRAVRADGTPDIGPWNDALGFTLKAMPPAGPAANADAASKTTLALRWAAGLAGDRYHVQLARDAAFDGAVAGAMLVDTRVDAPTLSAPRPPPGRYGVRIAIVNAEGTEGPFGPVQAFDVAKIDTRSWWWLLEPIGVLAGFLVGTL